jgi:hypothetical protein
MKDYLRDYATAAFRFYAQNGKSAEQYKSKIYEEALENIRKSEKREGVSKPTEAAVMAAERAVNEKIAEIKDMEAVELTLAELGVKRRHDIIQAVEFVYFKNAEDQLEDIKAKVLSAQINIPASERAIYYWLRQARQLFAIERGLRLH